jgi:hypothetical protein
MKRINSIKKNERRDLLRQKFGGRCAYCGDATGRDGTVDHQPFPVHARRNRQQVPRVRRLHQPADRSQRSGDTHGRRRQRHLAAMRPETFGASSPGSRHRTWAHPNTHP